MIRKIICFILAIYVSCHTVKSEECENQKKVVCYYGSWAYYRPEKGKFTTEDIDPSLCTNIIYTFVGLDIYLHITSLDTQVDLNLGGFSNVTKLKEDNPCLKVTLAIGGWNEGSIKYSVMASSEKMRDEFVENMLKFLVYYGFDGLDLDWEYPTIRGGISKDKQNYADLLKTIKQAFEPWGLMLTIAVPIDEGLLETAYDVDTIKESVDYVHLMAYDYTTASSNVTGLLAPLSAIKSTVTSWLNKGLPSTKLVLGMPAYARYFVLVDKNENGIGAAVSENLMEGPYTGEAGFLAYYEVQDMLRGGVRCQIQTTDDTNYAYCEDEWVSYDSVDTYKIKTKYAMEQDLGGVMLWSIDTDDFMGTFGDKYPVLTAINGAIKEYHQR